MTKLPVTTIKELKCRKYSLGSWSIYNQNQTLHIPEHTRSLSGSLLRHKTRP